MCVDRVVAIILHHGCVLLIHRRKAGRDYYVLPGGSIEAGETTAEACVREVREETNLAVVLKEQLCTLMDDDRAEHYFVVESFSGEPYLGGPERDRHSPDNWYHLEWVAKERLVALNLQPPAIRSCLLALL